MKDQSIKNWYIAIDINKQNYRHIYSDKDTAVDIIYLTKEKPEISVYYIK